jgi:peptidylprolyl isomerase
MKKSIVTIILMLGVCAGFALSQTKRKPIRRPVRKTVVKKTPLPIKPMIEQQAITTASGLTYIVTKKGDGAQLKAGDEIIVNYTGLLTSGQKFDSSLDRGEPFSFTLGAGRVIKGWDEGFGKLKIGDHATLIIPSSIAYGERGAGGVIPPGATLIFIVEVIGVK